MPKHVGEVVKNVVFMLREEAWRGKVIYVPKGPAREYSEFAVSLYKGCHHGCTYCFAPSQLRMTREGFKSVVIRDRVLEKLERDAEKMKGFGWQNVHVLMSFTTDPYPIEEREYELTRRGIEILHKYGIGVTILTKAGELAIRDFDILGKMDEFATTLTYMDDDFKFWEPYAADPVHRLMNLKMAKRAGIPTWASIEPVFSPIQTMKIVSASIEWVDLYKIGKLNHSKEASDVDWVRFTNTIVEFLEKNRKKYILKKDLLKAIEN